MLRIHLIALVVTVSLHLQAGSCLAQGPLFTYQGRLNDGGSPANGGGYGMVFYLYDSVTNGNLLGNLGIPGVSVSNGLFTVPLNFGNVFDGGPRWLEIAVQKNGGGFTTLSPRQPLTPTPYAVFANTASNVSGTVSGGQISGVIPLAGLPAGVVTNGASGVNISGTFTGNGAGITNVNLLGVNASAALGLGYVAAQLSYTPVENEYSDSGVDQTIANVWTNIPFQRGRVFEGSYDAASGTWTAGRDGDVTFALRGTVGRAGNYPSAGNTVYSGANETAYQRYDVSLTLPVFISVGGVVPMVKGQRLALTIKTMGSSLSIEPMSGTIMVYPWREAAPAVQTYLETVAAQSVASNTFTFSGGPFGGRASWSPSADGSYNEMVPRDAIIAVRYYPAGFSTTDLTNLAGQVAFLQGKHDAGVSVAITISGSCVTNGQSNVDHSDEFVDLLYTCYKRMGDASIFSRYYANATNTLAYQFTTNGLIFLRPDQASRAGFGFEDSEAVYGYNAMCSLYRYRSCQQMGEMLTALGQTAEAQTYSNQMAAIRSSLMTNLWDGSRHLFRAGTISNATQHSIMASAYAVVIGAVSNDTALVIATRLKDMLVGGSEALAGRGGFLAGQARSMPEDEFWTVTEAEPGDYQNGGYWALGTAWCARAIALVDAAAASQLMADLGRRYYNLSLAELPYEWENPQTHSPARGALRYLASGTAPLGFYSTEPR